MTRAAQAPWLALHASLVADPSADADDPDDADDRPTHPPVGRVAHRERGDALPHGGEGLTRKLMGQAVCPRGLRSFTRFATTLEGHGG